MVRTISTGKPSTLKTYYDIAVALFGEGSKPAEFLADKAAEQGWDEEVVADERQMIYLIGTMGTSADNERGGENRCLKSSLP